MVYKATSAFSLLQVKRGVWVLDKLSRAVQQAATLWWDYSPRPRIKPTA
jgi:hypothetical protein